MGRMLYQALILILALEIGFAFFEGTGVTNSPVYLFVNNFINMSSTGFYVLIFTAIATIGVGGILVGTQIIKSDWVWRAILAGTFITFGAILVQVYTFILREGDLLKGATTPLALIVSGSLGLFFLMTILDFISGKD